MNLTRVNNSEDEAVPGPSGINSAPQAVAPVPIFEEEGEEEGEVQQEGEVVVDEMQMEEHAGVNAEDVQEQRPDQDRILEPSRPELLIGVPFNIRVLIDVRISSRFEILDEEVFGQGSWIFPAIRRIDGRQVMLKCVHVSPDEPRDCGWMRSYRHAVLGFQTPVFQEIGMLLEMQLAPLPCTEIVRMLDWFQFPDGYIVVLERLSKPWVTLETFIQENQGLLRERVARDIMLQLLRTFTFFTRCRVRHIALTPQHIMINTETLNLKIVGFGQSRRKFFEDLEGDQSTVPFTENPIYLRTMYRIHVMQLPALLNSMLGLNTGNSVTVSLECLSFTGNCLSPRLWQGIEYLLNHPWMTTDNWT